MYVLLPQPPFMSITLSAAKFWGSDCRRFCWSVTGTTYYSKWSSSCIKTSSCQMHKFAYTRSQKGLWFKSKQILLKNSQVFFPTRKTLIAPILLLISVSLFLAEPYRTKPYILELLGLVPWSYYNHPLMEVIHEKPNYQTLNTSLEFFLKGIQNTHSVRIRFCAKLKLPCFPLEMNMHMLKDGIFPSALPKERF